MMTITESATEIEASRQSFSCMQALTMLAILAYMSMPQAVNAVQHYSAANVTYESEMESTNQFSEVEFIMQAEEYKIFQAINDVYDDLLANQSELDSKAKEILYNNLWDLYE